MWNIAFQLPWNGISNDGSLKTFDSVSQFIHIHMVHRWKSVRPIHVFKDFVVCLKTMPHYYRLLTWVSLDLFIIWVSYLLQVSLAIRCGGVSRLILCRTRQSRRSHFLGRWRRRRRRSRSSFSDWTLLNDERRTSERRESPKAAAAATRPQPPLSVALAHSLTHKRTGSAPTFLASCDLRRWRRRASFSHVRGGGSVDNRAPLGRSPFTTSHCCLTFTTDSFVRSFEQLARSQLLLVRSPSPPSFLPSPSSFPLPLSLQRLKEARTKE